MGFLKQINILITGAGAPGIAGTIYALKNNPDNVNFRVISTDINDDVVGKFLSDGFYKIPPPESNDYIQVLEDIALKENIKVILPQTTREIIKLSESKDRFSNQGIAVVVSSFESIRVANDKYLLLEKAREIGVPYPAYFLANSIPSLLDAIKILGYPQKKVVVKPRISSGMRGLRVITNESWNLKKFLSEKPEGIEINLDQLLDILKNNEFELLVTEYLPGIEYTIDVFRGKSGVIAIPRIREKIRSGITFDAKVVLNSDLINYAMELAKALDLKYCFGFQFKSSEEGISKLIEANPRVQGTMVVSLFAGFNIIYYSILEALGYEIDLSRVKLKDNIKFKRYWGGIAIDNEILGKI